MARSLSTEAAAHPATRTAAAFAGVFDPRRTASGEALRGRIETAVEAEGPALRADHGDLSIGWTDGVECTGSKDGGIACLLHGHIYNRDDLAGELGLPEGTEVTALLAAGYASLGTALLAKLRGDFALVLWDPKSRTGLLARDQLGGRALFLHNVPGGIAFASEVRNLTRLLQRKPAPDAEAVKRWFAPGLMREDRTLFEGVEPLPPATYLHFGADAIDRRHYWAPQCPGRSAISMDDAGEAVLSSLRQAVERRLGPNDSTAVLLSGGIDSASVAGVAAAKAPEGQRLDRSYSIVLPGHPEIDEGLLIRSIAADLGLRATGLELSSGGLLCGALPYLDAWDQPPLATTLFFLHPLLQRAGDDGIRVMLDGEGGDALFWHPAALLTDRLRHGRVLAAWLLAGRFPEYGVPTSWRTRLDRIRQARGWLDARPVVPAWLALEQADGAEPAARDLELSGPAWWRAHVAGIVGLGSQLMHDLSRRHAALSGIEARHPLLDVDLIDLVLSFPPELAFDRRYNRPVLREAVRGMVPDAVRRRPYKSNFDAVLIDGLRADLPVVERLLLAPGAEIGAYVDRRGLEAHLASPPGEGAALREWSKLIWFLATMELWLRRQAGYELLPAQLTERLTPAKYGFVEL